MKPFLLLQILFVLLASTFIVAGAFVTVIAPLFGVGIRMLIAGGLMLAYVAWPVFAPPSPNASSGGRKATPGFAYARRDLWLFALMGLIHIAIPYAGEFWSLVYISPIKVTFIWNMAPFMTALAALVFFRQHLKLRQWLGIAIGFIGFLPMLHTKTTSFADLFSIGVPEAVLIGAVAASAVAWLVFAKLLDRGYSPFFINAISMLQGGAWCLGLSAITEPWGAGLVCNWPLTIVYMTFLIVVANFICYNLYGRMLQTYSATFMAFASQLIAFYTAIMGWCLGDTFLTWHFWGSFAIVALGLYIFCYPQSQEIKTV